MTGWIKSRKFIECGIYAHLTYVKDNLSDFPPEVHELFNYVQETYEQCEEQSRTEGNCHAEWHRYEIVSDSLGVDVTTRLYNLGWIRVGSAKPSMYFEGTPEVLKENMQFCKDLADSYDMSANFERRN